MTSDLTAPPTPASHDSRRPRSPRGHGAALRDELVRAAAHLLDLGGDPDQVTTRAIASAVGVAPTALYLHFADRDELLVTVVEERFRELQRVIDAADPGGDPVDALVARGEAYVAFAHAHPGHYRVLFGGLQLWRDRPELATRCQAAGAPAFAALVAAVQRALDAGRLQGPDPFPIAVGMWSLVHGYADLTRVQREGLALPDVYTVLTAWTRAFVTPLDTPDPSGSRPRGRSATRGGPTPA